MSGPLRIGILGAAAIAPHAVIKPARGHERIAVVAVAARDPERAGAFAEKWDIDRVHCGYEGLVTDPLVDAVYVPLPNGLHGRWTRAAIEAGKHVLCEKPFTANATEAAEIASLAADNPGLVVMEALHWRYHPQTQRVLALLAKGAIGELQTASASFCVPNPRRHDIRWRADLAGGALMDVGAYPVNMLRTFVSGTVGAEPVVMSAEAKFRSPEIDRAMRARLDIGGVDATLHCSMWSRSIAAISLRLTGTRGEIRVFNPVAPQYLGLLSVKTPTRTWRERAARSTSYRHQLDAFCASVLDGEPNPTGASEAVANMAVIDDIYRSAGMAPRRPS